MEPADPIDELRVQLATAAPAELPALYARAAALAAAAPPTDPVLMRLAGPLTTAYAVGPIPLPPGAAPALEAVARGFEARWLAPDTAAAVETALAEYLSASRAAAGVARDAARVAADLRVRYDALAALGSLLDELARPTGIRVTERPPGG